MKPLALLPAILFLAACAGGEARPRPAAYRPIPFRTGSGLSAVIGKDAGALTALFGQPNADVREGVGRKLRSLRHAAGKTLEQVAGDIGIATSVLSTFERTSLGVTFRVLHDLADYYGTTVSKLSGEEEEDNRSVVRAGEWKFWPETSPGVTVQVLADGRNMMDCHRFVLAPGASSDGAYTHDGEEFVHVLSGQVEIVLDGHEFHDLGPGDSLYFSSCRRHAWRNRHDGETVLIWINTPPTF